MTRDDHNPKPNMLNNLTKSVTDRVKRWRGQPPAESSGSSQPRRRPGYRPIGAGSPNEPRIALYRRFMKQGRPGGHR
jgi:hypothetical protein